MLGGIYIRQDGPLYSRDVTRQSVTSFAVSHAADNASSNHLQMVASPPTTEI